MNLKMLLGPIYTPRKARKQVRTIKPLEIQFGMEISKDPMLSSVISINYLLGVSSNSNWGAFFRLGMLVCYLPKIPLTISQKYPSVSPKNTLQEPKNTPQYLPKIPLRNPKIPLTISQKYPSLSPKNTPHYLPKIPINISQKYHSVTSSSSQ